LLTLKSCLAAEWARYGIRVNSLSPGYMDTILNEGEGIAEARKIWADRNPLGRMGTPNELTGTVVLLSSMQATYINGMTPELNKSRATHPPHPCGKFADGISIQERILLWMEVRYFSDGDE
jgi:NAD(P)-dependent dehydrogenase (short-subunit alcohol dehydrogenase family)